MAVIVERTRWVLHPLNAVLLAGTLALFLGALLSDIAYFRSYEIQWNNFSSWLLAGALVVGALAFLAAVVDLFRDRWRVWPVLVYGLLVLATWILGFIDELVHARDAWASMPAGLVLSVIVVALACAALWIAFAGIRVGEAP
ncbi:MAG TPA: DUF2231 domain-containing protein [Rhodanobacteraceae bacterium]|nr:DUF2231 domain-containing protein [Rhodanobacteraceae bacterium]